MLRSLTMIAILMPLVLGVGNLTKAEEIARLNQPSQTITLGTNGVQMIAFYDRREDVLDLNILITDTDGETLRTRIGLRHRQHHTMLLPSSSDLEGATRVEFLRTGEQVEMVMSADPIYADMAAR